jgi:hypothetical protein
MMFRPAIAQHEIDDAVRFLVERHGDAAREEAERLADVGRRLGSWRNSALFRRAARALGEQGGAPSGPVARSWLDALRDYGRARVEAAEG